MCIGKYVTLPFVYVDCVHRQKCQHWFTFTLLRTWIVMWIMYNCIECDNKESLNLKQVGLKVSPLYSFINEISTFFMITKQRVKISSINFQCICFIRLWLQLYEYIFMTSLMMSPGHKIGQILKLIYLPQYMNYSVDQKLKMSEMLMAIFLVHSTSGITSGKKVCPELKMAAILKILKYWTQLQFDIRYENIVPNSAKEGIFMIMASSMMSQGGLKFISIFMFRRGWLREQIAKAMSRQ